MPKGYLNKIKAPLSHNGPFKPACNTHISCQSFDEFASSVILKWLLHLSYISCAHPWYNPIIYRSYFWSRICFHFCICICKKTKVALSAELYPMMQNLIQDLFWCLRSSIFIYDCRRQIRPTCSWSRFRIFAYFFPEVIFERRL